MRQLSAMRRIDRVRPVEGTRDLYPADIQLRNWLSDRITTVLERYGFDPWDAPLLEPLSLYTPGSNLALVQQRALVFDGAGDEPLVLRPELTASLARAVSGAGARHSLPLRWYSYGPFWRNEPLRAGRGREFRQWNIDMIGASSPWGDTEMVILAIDLLRAFGLSAEHVRLRVSSRAMLGATLERMGLRADERSAIMQHLDQAVQVPDVAPLRAALEACLQTWQKDCLEQFLNDEEGWKRDGTLRAVFDAVDALGWVDYLTYDPGIVRAATYYTGLVFEAFPCRGGLPAVLGGGRYDGLMESVGGRSVPGIGFALGDLPLIESLEAIDKLPEVSPQPVAALILANRPEALASAHRLAHGLREAGVRLEIRALTDSVPLGSPAGFQNEARWIVFPVYQGQDAGQFVVRNTHTGARFLCGLDEAIELVVLGLPGNPGSRQCIGSTGLQWLKGGECIERTRAVASRSSIQR